MPPLVSALIPTRTPRFPGLQKTITSLLSNAADRSRIEIVLKLDDDDKAMLDKCSAFTVPQVKIVVTPRGNGYTEMPRFVGEAADAASGAWCFLIDDDAWIEGKGWDDQLAAIEPNECACQCEFYHLGRSKYGSGSCGTNGLFVPTPVARLISKSVGQADNMLQGLTVGRGWPLHLLKGINYCHDGRAR